MTHDCNLETTRNYYVFNSQQVIPRIPSHLHLPVKIDMQALNAGRLQPLPLLSYTLTSSTQPSLLRVACLPVRGGQRVPNGYAFNHHHSPSGYKTNYHRHIVNDAVKSLP